jgi:hypothetical protein
MTQDRAYLVLAGDAFRLIASCARGYPWHPRLEEGRIGEQENRHIVKRRDTLAAEPGHPLRQAYLDVHCQGGLHAVTSDDVAALVGKHPPEHSR